ncbi:MAG: hypothetical protein ABI947_24880 [Chloroflexota bacterium]
MDTLANRQVVVLGVLPDRQKSTLEAFLKSIPDGVRKTIHSAWVEMYDTYRLKEI